MTISQPSAISQTVNNPSHRRLVDTLIVDAGPIISSASTPSYYLTTAERIFTTPAVISEIRDKTTRLRFETIWKPFLTVKAPRVESLKFVVEFAKKTGDYKALSSTDLGLIALAYELELEVAEGDQRLRNLPGQKELNGPLPAEG
jgi:RNA-binding protein NOB1